MRRSWTKGFTLIETLVALAIAAVVMVGYLAASHPSISTSAFDKARWMALASGVPSPSTSAKAGSAS